MSITHVNAKGKTCYLHQGTTKAGKPKYHFAMKSEDTLADAIPEGFEIYEHPNAQVFLRRIPPKIITDKERQIVEDGMRKYVSVTAWNRANTVAPARIVEKGVSESPIQGST